MRTKQAVSGGGNKHQKEKMVYVGIKLDAPISRRLRIAAATSGISLAELTRRILDETADGYLGKAGMDMAALEAIETSASMAMLRAAKEAQE